MQCKKCILDITVPDISFDSNGICDYCHLYSSFEKIFPLGKEGMRKLHGEVREIKEHGVGKDYDCVVGVSGGVDSSYTLHVVKRLGLRPLAVHIDNNWNSELAVKNIEVLIKKLDVDLETVVLDWHEFKQLQVAFLEASVPDLEIPTDWAIHSNLHKVASKESIKYVIHGHSFRTEGTAPLKWTYMDGLYIEDIYQKFTSKKFKNYENMKLFKLIKYKFFDGIKEFRPLEYIKYDKSKAARVLKLKYDWQPYSGHHHENYYSRFVHSYVFPEKFDIDYRKVALSAQILSGLIDKKEALQILQEPILDEKQNKEDVDYIIKKLDLDKKDFDLLISRKPLNYQSYKNYHELIKILRPLISIAVKMNFLPSVISEKYAK